MIVAVGTLPAPADTSCSRVSGVPVPRNGWRDTAWPRGSPREMHGSGGGIAGIREDRTEPLVGQRVVGIETQRDVVVQPRGRVVVGAQQQAGQVDVSRRQVRMARDSLREHPAGRGDGAAPHQQQAEFVERAGIVGATLQHRDQGLLGLLAPVGGGEHERAINFGVDRIACRELVPGAVGCGQAGAMRDRRHRHASRGVGGGRRRSGELRGDVAAKYRRADMIEPAVEIGPDLAADVGPALAEREILAQIGAVCGSIMHSNSAKRLRLRGRSASSECSRKNCSEA